LKARWLFVAVPAALILGVLVFESVSGSGHPSLSAILLFWASYPTLTGYLSRALAGYEFPPRWPHMSGWPVGQRQV
jgi:hypothetical protein